MLIRSGSTPMLLRLNCKSSVLKVIMLSRHANDSCHHFNEIGANCGPCICVRVTRNVETISLINWGGGVLPSLSRHIPGFK